MKIPTTNLEVVRFGVGKASASDEPADANKEPGDDKAAKDDKAANGDQATKTNKDDAGNNDAFIVVFRIPPEARKNVEISYSPGGTVQKPYDPEFIHLKLLNAQKGFKSQLGFIRIEFLRYRQNNFVKPDLIRKVLGSELKLSPYDVAKAFIDRQQDVLIEEQKAYEDQLKSLRREECVVKISELPGDPPRLSLSIQSTAEIHGWKLEVGWKLSLRAASVFEREAPMPDPNGSDMWTAHVTSISSSSSVKATVFNRLPDVRNYVNQRVQHVTVEVIEEDLLAKRMTEALELAANQLHAEYHPLADPKKTAAHILKIPLSRLLVKHSESKSADWPHNAVSLKNTPLEFKAEWNLERSHEEVVSNIVKGHGGITGIQGPPGTGKSTLIAKCAAIMITESNLEDDIVMSAHSNQAVQVLVEKNHDTLREFGLDAEEVMVLVETSGALSRRRQFRNSLKPELEVYSLENQVLRIANGDPSQYATYLRLHGACVRGDAMTKAEEKEYYNCRGRIVQKIKDTRKIFISTISTLATRFYQHSFAMDRPFTCGMWFIDEASQCPMPAFIEGWQKMNPSHMVIGGDFRQLQPYTLSDNARELWSCSPIWYAQQLGPQFCTLLDVQFRMKQHLYQPTCKIFYDGRIVASPKTASRSSDIEILHKIQRIEYDHHGRGDWRPLRHNVRIFHLEDGEQHTYGETSSVNPIEAEVVGRLIKVLNDAGVSMADIMALVPYEGQYQQLRNFQRNTEGATNLAIRKVNSSQGDERPIVIFSPTKVGRMGILSSSQKHNVATSRQKSAFFLVGNTHHLNSNDRWRKWLDEVRQANINFGLFVLRVNRHVQFRVRAAPDSTPQTVKNYAKATASKEPAVGHKLRSQSVEAVQVWRRIAADAGAASSASAAAPTPAAGVQMNPAPPDAPIFYELEEMPLDLAENSEFAALGDRIKTWRTDKNEAAELIAGLTSSAAPGVAFEAIAKYSGLFTPDELALVLRYAVLGTIVKV